MEKKEEKLTFSDKLGKWILKNRIVLISILSVILVVGIASAIIFSVVSKNTEKKYAEIYALSTEYVQLTEEDKEAKTTEILDSVLNIAGKNAKNGVGIRAYMLAAEIYYQNKDYEAAAEAYKNAANANLKAYTAPLCFYNAAVCYEELGNIDAAIEYINKANDCENFTLKAKGLFNLGRLEEQRGNTDAAIEYYNALINDFGYDQWTTLAKSRVLLLSK